jgi:uncharacterized membrane protein YjgN (DUF898 family)
LLIALVLGLIFSMVMWPQWWRRYYQKRHDVALKKGKVKLESKKTFNIWLLIAMILILLCGVIIGSMLGFKQAIDHIPQPVLATSCIEYNQCSQIDCSQLMTTGCPGCVCSYCGDPKYNGAVRIEIPYPSKS